VSSPPSGSPATSGSTSSPAASRHVPPGHLGGARRRTGVAWPSAIRESPERRP
jgi:hypothetical protein